MNKRQCMQYCKYAILVTVKRSSCMYISVADLGEGPGGPPPFILGKKEEMTEGKKASRARKSRPPPLP